MTKILHALMGLLCPILMVAQAPQSFNYQAVARDDAGQVLAQQSLHLRFTILEADTNGTSVYQEEHSTTTNDFGLFSAAVGNGTVISGDFANIGWASNAHYLKVEINEGSGYQTMGNTQLLSVPYAIYASSSGSSGGYSAGTGITINNNVIANTGDIDPNDDITNSTSAQGDVSGNFPTLTVTGVQNRPVASTAPAQGDVLKWNGSEWAPAVDDQGSGGGSSVWNTTGNDIYYSSGNVGIGINSPTTALDVKGTMELSTGGANNEEFAIGVTPTGELSFYPNNTYNEPLFLFDDESPFLTIDNNSNTNPNGLRLYQNGGFKAALVYNPEDNVANFTRDVRFTRIALDGNNNVVIGGTQGDGDAALTVNGQFNNGRIKMGSSEFIEDGGPNSVGVGGNLIPSEDDTYSIGLSPRRWKEVFATNGTINTSDAKAKENIRSVNYGIDDLMQLAPVSYNLKDDAFNNDQIGFLAQDLLEIFPEVVRTHDEIINEQTGEVTRQKAQVLGVYYHRLIPILVKSIQQQQMRINALENKIDAMQQND